MYRNSHAIDTEVALVGVSCPAYAALELVFADPRQRLLWLEL